MYVELMDPERMIHSEINDSRLTRDDVAMTYAMILRQRADIDWAKVNAAIVERWSLSALRYIKEKAWRLVEGKG